MENNSNNTHSQASKRIISLCAFMLGIVSIAGSNQVLLPKQPVAYTEVETKLDSLSNLLDHHAKQIENTSK